MKKEQPVYIVGIGDDGLEGLTSAARQRVEQAELLIAAPQLLNSVSSNAEKQRLGGNLQDIVECVEMAVNKRIVLLTGGDPLFYGVARYLCEKLGKERFEVVPHVSSMQLAFARVKESWDEAYLANLASVPLERLTEKVRTAEKVGLFTTDDCGPSQVASHLLSNRIDYFSAYVCENLGSPDERVTHSELSEIVEQPFSPLNVMILVRKPEIPDRPVEMFGRRLFGNPDEAFLQSRPKRGLLTPREVRIIALAEMDLGPQSIVWDVGAGSGSVAIEAALIASQGKTYAIEMDPEDYQLLEANAQRFNATNLVPVLGQAPDVWDELDNADAIFVGGTGRTIQKIVEHAIPRLRPHGRIVANSGSIDNLHEVHQILNKAEMDPCVRMINIACSTDQLERVRFEAANPTFLISGVLRK